MVRGPWMTTRGHGLYVNRPTHIHIRMYTLKIHTHIHTHTSTRNTRTHAHTRAQSATCSQRCSLDPMQLAIPVNLAIDIKTTYPGHTFTPESKSLTVVKPITDLKFLE